MNKEKKVTLRFDEKRLKEINQKLDTLLDCVVAIQTLLIRKNVLPDNRIRVEPRRHTKEDPMPHKTMREQADQDAEDDHYWDPTKFPETGVSESDEHFK